MEKGEANEGGAGQRQVVCYQLEADNLSTDRLYVGEIGQDKANDKADSFDRLLHDKACLAGKEICDVLPVKGNDDNPESSARGSVNSSHRADIENGNDKVEQGSQAGVDDDGSEQSGLRSEPLGTETSSVGLATTEQKLVLVPKLSAKYPEKRANEWSSQKAHE